MQAALERADRFEKDAHEAVEHLAGLRTVLARGEQWWNSYDHETAEQRAQALIDACAYWHSFAETAVSAREVELAEALRRMVDVVNDDDLDWHEISIALTAPVALAEALLGDTPRTHEVVPLGTQQALAALHAAVDRYWHDEGSSSAPRVVDALELARPLVEGVERTPTPAEDPSEACARTGPVAVSIDRETLRNLAGLIKNTGEVLDGNQWSGGSTAVIAGMLACVLGVRADEAFASPGEEPRRTAERFAGKLFELANTDEPRQTLSEPPARRCDNCGHVHPHDATPTPDRPSYESLRAMLIAETALNRERADEIERLRALPAPSGITDEQVEAAAVVLAGAAPCHCPDDPRQPFDRRFCPGCGDAPWPRDPDRRRAREILAAALELQGGERTQTGQPVELWRCPDHHHVVWTDAPEPDEAVNYCFLCDNDRGEDAEQVWFVPIGGEHTHTPMPRGLLEAAAEIAEWATGEACARSHDDEALATEEHRARVAVALRAAARGDRSVRWPS